MWWAVWARSQKSGLSPSTPQSRRSVSGVIARSPAMISLMREAGTPMALANSY
jgi:hypothetical protein